MPDDIRQHSLWGQVFEIAVKRGVLVSLLASEVKKPEQFKLDDWRKLSITDIYYAMARELQEVDPGRKSRLRGALRHVFQIGMGLGQTAMREYLRNLDYPEEYAIRAIWCPLQLPRIDADYVSDTDKQLRQFWKAFGLPGNPDPALASKGFPARADFLLWLAPSYESLNHEFLCVEFSLNSFFDVADYSKPDAHLEDLKRYVKLMDSRSVFSQVCAEVSGEGFSLSSHISEYLPAFTGRDKPLYKLCQAASYVHNSMRWLDSIGLTDRPFNTRALSITPNGFESLAARYFQKDIHDPRCLLMESLGKAYRETQKIHDYENDELEDYIRLAFDKIRKSLPGSLGKQLAELKEVPQPGRDVEFSFSEKIDGFYNPMQNLTWDEAQDLINSDANIASFLGQDPKAAITAALNGKIATGSNVPLRDLHAAAIVAGMRSSGTGQLSVIALEGNPGIGKTTAVTRYLRELNDGFMFIYVSPRVVINDDVTGNLSIDRATNKPTGILTITTNYNLISAARDWYDSKVKDKTQDQRMVDSAVIASGVDDLIRPDISTLVLSPEQKEELEKYHAGSRFIKHSETEHQDRITDRNLPGVLNVLAKTCRSLLDVNPHVNKIVMSVAIQGYKEVASQKTTLNALRNIFHHSVATDSGIQERKEFAKRIPTIAVMVDEITGDQAGAVFVNDIARWLDEQFVRPFKNNPIFRAILIVSDASLVNETVLDRYINSGATAPDKVLVSQSSGNRPFRLSVTPIKIGGMKRDVLHIMTNSYPARSLTIDYRLRLNILPLETSPDGETQSVRRAIAGRRRIIINNAVDEIIRALRSGAKQVIFFAQDKSFLREVAIELKNNSDFLDKDQIALLDSSIIPSKRKEIVTDQKRDAIKVFLMTSSGSRGVSFPKTDCIIVMIPRFDIESSLMEIAQLIYRGRGQNYIDDDGQLCSDGDWKNRRLIMLFQDFLPLDQDTNLRKWLRQVSDLLTMLVLLRAAIHTRITGDAGLDRQRLAIVPVGGIGTASVLSLMSMHVRNFMQECNACINDAAFCEHQSLMVSARNNAMEMFSKFSIEATLQDKNARSFVRIDDMEGFSVHASADNAPLLPNPKDDPDCVLPGNIYCVGPFWLEHWENLDKLERFSIEGWNGKIKKKYEKMLAQLSMICSDRILPHRLRTSARELHSILIRQKENTAKEFCAIKKLRHSAWLAIPVDYARFWKPDQEGRMPSLNEEEAWCMTLGRCLSPTINFLPVVPRYAGIPYAALVGERNPARLDLVFDDRYMAASNELNLLNVILL